MILRSRTAWLACWLIVLVLLQCDISAQARQLQQACPVANCAASSCLFGTSKQWTCARCRSGYESTPTRAACVCRAGTFKAAAACVACTVGFYCKQGSRTQCPGGLTTASQGASSLSSCVNPPGTRFAPHATRPSAVPCGADEYSLGLQRQPSCSSCPRGLKTDPATPLTQEFWHTSSSVCKAPPGYFMLSGAATPCAVGSFAPGYTSSSELSQCIRCSEQRGAGLTTLGSASTTLEDCFVLQPGYAALTVSGLVLTSPISSRGDLDNVKAKLCPQGYYCPGGDPRDAAALPQPCPTGLMTQAEGASSANACLAPPGWSWDGSNGVECAAGYYKQGWDRAGQCTACGTPIGSDTLPGWLSDRMSTVVLFDPRTSSNSSKLRVRGSPSSCYIRTGMGTARRVSMDNLSGTDGTLQALACPANYFGTSSTKLFSQGVVMCTACPVNQVTACPEGDAICTANLALYTKAYGATNTYFDKAACRNPAGFGWVNYLGGGTQYVMPCPQGSYSAGGGNSTCTACPTWMSTITANSTSSLSCVAPPGFTSTDSGSPAQKCATGTFKASYGNSACTDCGVGALWRSESTVNITFYNYLTMQQSQEKAPAAESSCYLPPGAGTTGTAPDDLTAATCDSSNYGAATRTYGRIATPCSDCATNLVTSCSTVTDATAQAACEGVLAGYKDPVSLGFTSELACRTQAGWGWNGTAAYQCSSRTYSTGGHRSDCTPCPVAAEGFATMTSFTSVTECFKLSPGYAAFDVYGQIILTTVANSSLLSTVAGATKCPVGYTCAGGYLSAAAAVPQACGDGLTTKTSATNDGLGASLASRCVAPAGFECTPDGSGVCTTATACADGYFKATYTNGACTSCGASDTNNAQGTWHSLSPATSASACYLLPGLGLSAGVVDTCDNNNYGSAAIQYGLSAASCTACPTNMQTACPAGVPTTAGCEIVLSRYTDPVTGGYISAVVCRTQAGYGYSGGVASQCAEWTYSWGGTHQPCSSCPVPAAGFQATGTGATSVAACYYLLAGYAAADGSGVIYGTVTSYDQILRATKCPVGFWCKAGNPVLDATVLPQACPTGLTTKSTIGDGDPGTGKASSADCKYNAPGYYCLGVDGSGACLTPTACAEGTGSPGFNNNLSCA